MAQHLALSTPDPKFDPGEPITVNGYLYLPADGHVRAMPGRRGPTQVVEVKRRRELAHG